MDFTLHHPNAVAPTKAHDADAGLDVYALCNFIIPPGCRVTHPLGITCNIEPGHALLVQERSGMAFRKGVMTIGNVIDSGYEGKLHVCLVNLDPSNEVRINQGDRIAQLVLIKLGDTSNFNPVSTSRRCEDGYGSSGV